MNSVVWLKRDLRLSDHRPLLEASVGECLVLYIIEPSLRAAEDFDDSHAVFINQSLQELAPRIEALGGRLVLAEGEVVEVLDRLFDAWPYDRLLSHEETGNDLSFRRDLAVKAWSQRRGIDWQEVPQHGVFRPLHDRDGWAARWRQRMNEPLAPIPKALRAPDVTLPFSSAVDALDATPHPLRQQGGEAQARETLRTFLKSRGERYATEMSSPVTAGDACSRLSPFLAWGNLSMREIFQRTESHAAALRRMKPKPANWPKSLAAHGKRLRWHCHFIQKLEDQPSLEWENMQRAMDGLREDDFHEDYFDAWKAGETGYPMVDACMRALKETKWINFRMRAMLVSFASYHLWLDWRRTAPWLAKHFLDYEPGIHYSQFQMQSGTTGINTLRIYSPAKQVLDQDPDGAFIHRWCPELEGLTGPLLANPETAGALFPSAYPAPVVDHAAATALARRRIMKRRQTGEARLQSRAVHRRHGSRKRQPNRRRA
ncbi:MAG: FAD-binding domain-containing protein [Pseudomonadota bacterium]